MGLVGRVLGGMTYMFGLSDDELIGNLEALRVRLCCYMGSSCDCKFGATGKGEQTGCPEIRQAIAIIAGQRHEVSVAERTFEDSAANLLSRLRALLEEHPKHPAYPTFEDLRAGRSPS